MSDPEQEGNWRRGRRASVGVCALVVLLAAGAAVLGVMESPAWTHGRTASTLARSTRPLSLPPPSTVPTTTTTTTTTTLPPPGPGFVAGRVTAIGDSVMLDYEGPLQAAVPGVLVTASVGRQWDEGEQIIQSLKTFGGLGAEVIIDLGTNGPITDADFDAMMSDLRGASRVVFVNVHVDRPWQDPNNAVLARGVARYPTAVLADWASLAAQNPAWFSGDGTHIAVDGAAATALASLVATTLATG